MSVSFSGGDEVSVSFSGGDEVSLSFSGGVEVSAGPSCPPSVVLSSASLGELVSVVSPATLSSPQLDFLWRRDGGRRLMEWRALPLLMLDRIDPSAAVGGASKEAGPSSSVTGVAATGQVGLAKDEVVSVVTGAEPGEGGLKLGGSSLKPGLFGEGAEGERARLA